MTSLHTGSTKIIKSSSNKIITIDRLFDLLLETLGEQFWWPARSKWELLIGAVLVQNTNWTNVSLSLKNLAHRTDFSPKAIRELTNQELQTLIRPSGFFNNKSRALEGILSWTETFNDDFSRLKAVPTDKIRKSLLQIKGVGPETADVIVVYLLDRPVFIADAYARRLFTLLGKETKSYEELQGIVHLSPSFNGTKANELHALIDVYGKQYLRKNTKEIGFLAGYKLDQLLD